MFKIENGKLSFYQWDINQRLIIEDPSITEVHFCNRTSDCALVCAVYEEGGKRFADVPNILLQEDWTIRVYAYSENTTLIEENYIVYARTKPDDYIYTETEVKCLEALEKRVEALEKNGISEEVINDAIERYLDENGVDVDLTGYATEQYVDDAIANIGGGSGVLDNNAELICDITLEEEVQNITISTDKNGNPLELEKAYIRVDTGGNKAVEPGHNYFRIYIETQSGGIKNSGDIQVANIGMNLVNNANVECHAVFGVLKPNIVEKFAMLRTGYYSKFDLSWYGKLSMLDVMPYNMDKIVSIALKVGSRYPVGTNIKIYKMG